MPKARKSSSRRRRTRFEEKYSHTVIPSRYKLVIPAMQPLLEAWLRYQDELEKQVIAILEGARAGAVCNFVVTKPPTACNVGWANCANAHVDDDNYAEGTLNQQCIWSAYGFTIPAEATVNAVRVNLKGYQSHAQAMGCILEVYNGLAWGAGHLDVLNGHVGACEEEIVDVTPDFSWTPNMVNAIQARLRVDTQGGAPPRFCRACYIPIEIEYSIITSSIPSELWPYYLAFAKRAFQFYYKFDQSTSKDEVDQLIQEFIRRGLDSDVLDQIAAVAKTKGELAKQES